MFLIFNFFLNLIFFSPSCRWFRECAPKNKKKIAKRKKIKNQNRVFGLTGTLKSQNNSKCLDPPPLADFHPGVAHQDRFESRYVEASPSTRPTARPAASPAVSPGTRPAVSPDTSPAASPDTSPDTRTRPQSASRCESHSSSTASPAARPGTPAGPESRQVPEWGESRPLECQHSKCWILAKSRHEFRHPEECSGKCIGGDNFRNFF